MPFRMFSRTCSFLLALVICGATVLQAAELKPFATLQVAGPSTLVSIAEKFGTLFDPDDTSDLKTQLAPYKNMAGVSPTGNFGLALMVNPDNPLGIEAVLVLPISDFNAFTIAGMEDQIAMLRMMIPPPQGGKYTIASPVGNFVAYQKTGYFVLATEGAADFVATADPKNLFAEVADFTLGLHLNLENISLKNVESIIGSLALPLAMSGMDMGDVDMDQVLTYLKEQIFDEFLSLTFGATLDPKTLNLTGMSQVMPKKGSESAERFAKMKTLETKLGAFLLDSPKTIASLHFPYYLTDSEMKALNTAWESIAAGFVEGFTETFDDKSGDRPEGDIANFVIEYGQEVLDFFIEERLIDSTIALDSDGTLVVAFASIKTEAFMTIQEKFFDSLLKSNGDAGKKFKDIIEAKVKRDYETIAGYSLSCIPDLLGDLPTEWKGGGEKIPVNFFWGVKNGEAVMVAFGLDFAKTEKTLKAALQKTATPTPPEQSWMFAVKPLGELLQNEVIPRFEQSFGEEIREEGKEFIAKLAAVDADVKATGTTEFPGAGYAEKYQVSGQFFSVFVDLFIMPAVQASQGAAKRMTCSNNMKNLTLALHSYHDTFSGLPPLYTVDTNGKPLHSWRVLLLPFLEESALYDEIRLDEPWDSTHNKQFHNAVVSVYSCPENPLVAPGKACTYSAVAGVDPLVTGSLRPGIGQKPRDTFAYWADGTSNQIVFVEVKQPFCWMDPTADVTMDELVKGINAANGRVGSFHKDGCNVGMGDGSVRFVPNSVAPSILRALADPNDGQNVTLP